MPMETSSPHGRERSRASWRHHRYQRFYVLHSTLVFAILFMGVLRNGGHRKYISVDPQQLHSLLSSQDVLGASEAVVRSPCHRAYVNVHASAIDEEFAAICCSDAASGQETQLCDPRIPLIGASARHLPFATRLNRMAEAWLLPLSPILMRLAYQLVMVVYAFFAADATLADDSSAPNHTLIRFTLQRLLFYIMLITVRMFGLYVGADALEGYILSWSVTPSDHEPECWYQSALKGYQTAAMEGQSECYGRPFDFSDHVVLFLAQYFPVFVMEMLFYYTFPFWVQPATERAATTQRPSTSFFSIGHLTLFLYLHLIVFYNLYHTAVYFHTSAETLVGYAVSLILQVPVGYLMCSVGWRVKTRIGFPSEVMGDKGD